MNATLNEFVRMPGTPVPIQLTRFVRGLIQTGRLEPGQKLPSSVALAKLWGTQAARVHAALTPLVKEGLLNRTQCRGTFVRKAPRRFDAIGIYLLKDIWHEEDGVYCRAVSRALASEAAERGIRAQFFVDTRPGAQHGEPCPVLLSAIQQGEIQAVVVPRTDVAHTAWLNKLPVPVAMFLHFPVGKNVTCDFGQMLDKAFVELARQGCRTAGIITVANLRWLLADLAAPEADFIGILAARAAGVGVELRPDWVLQPEDTFLPETSASNFGRQAMKRLWSQNDRPEGVFVYTDVVARGVINTLFELHVQVPEELKLVLQRSQGVPLDCPLPAGFIDTSPAEAARNLIDQASQIFHGGVCQRRMLGFSVAPAPCLPVEKQSRPRLAAVLAKPAKNEINILASSLPSRDTPASNRASHGAAAVGFQPPPVRGL